MQRPAAVGRVHVIFSGAVRGQATILAGQLARAGFEVTPMALTTNLVGELRRADPDVVLVVAVASGGSFDLIRLCADLSSELICRIVVVASDPTTENGELEDELVIAALDAGAHAVLPVTTSAAVLAARLRAAIRTRSGPSIGRPLGRRER